MGFTELAKEIVEESIVLLKNDENLLPLNKGNKIAVFGSAQIKTIISGSGSGATSAKNWKNILEACEDVGFVVEPKLKDYYQKCCEEDNESVQLIDEETLKGLVHSGLIYEIFGKYQLSQKEYQIEDDLLNNARMFTDTAVLVLGRNSGGEECDRHLDDDYYLPESEMELIDQVNDSFENVVLVLNINGLIDLSWLEEKKHIKSLLYIGVPGQEGGKALANILVGDVSPSGKLAVTIAKNYEDYPASKHFTWTKDDDSKLLTYESYGLNTSENGSVGYNYNPITVYQESIYLGYRYFDTFNVDPLFPFGFGLSYTTFKTELISVKKIKGGIAVKVSVENTGKKSGKETIQLYVSANNEVEERPEKELKGFEKTKLLEPGEKELLTISMKWNQLAGYDENQAAYTITKGIYSLLVGNSSKDVMVAAKVTVNDNIITEKLHNRIEIQPCNKEKISFLSANHRVDFGNGLENLTLTAEEVLPQESRCPEKKYEKVNKKAKQVVKELNVQQLAALCVGYGSGIPFGAVAETTAPSTIMDDNGNPITERDHPTGDLGYISPAIKEKGISSVYYKDGPAGIGGIAWPTEMISVCSFNKDLWYAFGDAVGNEAEDKLVDFWLAPAVNIQRHPLGGRNFEYPSEDPYLTGIYGIMITKGAQENHQVLVCPKHFAINEQETYRRGSKKKNIDAVNSIIQERVAREIYLKPFEMMVKEAGVRCIMTSFNRINGVFAGANKDLCTHILRDEWGYEGYVITDWGDLDIVIDGADAVAAGNDVVMPGGPPVIKEILNGYEEGRVTRNELEKAVINLLGSNLK